MTWVSAALASAVFIAVANVVDSHLIQKRMPSLWSFLILAGILHIFFALILLIFYPIKSGVDILPWIVTIVSALTRAVAVLIMLYSMRTEEVSRIIPVTNTQPIFVAILAVPILGETLNYQQWLAIVITVAGAVLISMRWDGEGGGARLRKSFYMLMCSSVLFGLANIGTKYALDDFSSWNMYCVSSFCFGSFFILISLRPKVLSDIKNMNGRGSILTIVGLNEAVALGGILLSFWAMERGPISLVTTIQGSRPLFVFLIALALSGLFPAILNERFSRGIIAVKIASIGLIVGGVTIINLFGTS